MKNFLLFGLVLIFLNGCNSLCQSTLKVKKQGIIDAVYTVAQYNPSDKDERIKCYLDKKVQQDLLEEQERYILQECLKRTESSKNWSK